MTRFAQVARSSASFGASARHVPAHELNSGRRRAAGARPETIADLREADTLLELLGKPDKLPEDELETMKRHVVDGAINLRRTAETPAFARNVAFAPRLEQDLSSSPDQFAPRRLSPRMMVNQSTVKPFENLAGRRPVKYAPRLDTGGLVDPSTDLNGR